MVISVLVPAYPDTGGFSEADDGIGAASDVSIIWNFCIADGSGTDDSVENVVKEYQKKDPRVRYRRLEKNEGIAGNTNAAIEMASGEYLALFDHDDLLSPNALFEVASAI